MSRLLQRGTGPAGLVLTALCLLLPFLSASCASEETPRQQWRVTYTGVDVLAGTAPEVAFTEDADKTPIRELGAAEAEQLTGAAPLTLPAQPVAWLAVALMAAALGATGLPSRAWRTTAAAGLSLAAAVVLAGAMVLARRDVTDAVATVLRSGSASAPVATPVRQWDAYGEVGGMVHYAYGSWIAIALLAAVGVGHLVAALTTPPVRS
ncbi:hypothetical protein [Actinoplanes sp. RD1]|uniref:hypothetical protein n=1 Tax=Actinoplanes sp. RD1 TaxID=3064538 RepID=UPI002740CFB7|nr:hypothetical protein [Actinoplanes sp. RD1]